LAQRILPSVTNNYAGADAGKNVSGWVNMHVATGQYSLAAILPGKGFGIVQFEQGAISSAALPVSLS